MGEVAYSSPGLLLRARLATARLDALPFLLGAVSVFGLGAAHGGYFPTAWGWSILAFAAAVVWSLAVGSTDRPTFGEAVFLFGLAALAGWCALSALWGTPSSSIEEAFRVLLYSAGSFAAFTMVRRRSARALAGGVFAGISLIAICALATRLLPDRVGSFDPVATYRLATPIGYWNALGLLCAIGLLLSVSAIGSARSRVSLALAAAVAPLALLSLYFTFSRGSWISLSVGLIIVLALDSQRVSVLAVVVAIGIPSAIAVAVAAHSSALTHQGSSIARAARDGHKLALLMVALCLCSAGLALALTSVRERVAVPQGFARAGSLASVLVAIAATVTLLVHFGGPGGVAHRAWGSFTSKPSAANPDLTKRLFSFSGSGRADLYRVAWRDVEAHPIIGAGAGTYEAYWLSHRPSSFKVRDAHSLYLETFAELGGVGLALLLVALGAPLIAGVARRKRSGVPALTGAYVAYLVGAGIDWDWEITSVTLAGLLVAVAILAMGRDESPTHRLGPVLTWALIGCATATAAAGFVFLVGNVFLSRSQDAAREGHWNAAVHDARAASDWLPWSTRPWQQLAEAQLARGQSVPAQASIRRAIAKDSRDWSLWLDLARASVGIARRAALGKAAALNPRSPEIAEFRMEIGRGGGISITAGGG